MKPKAQNPYLTALILGTLLVAGSFWAKISFENPTQTTENQAVETSSAVEVARLVLSVLPATSDKKATPALPEKP